MKVFCDKAMRKRRALHHWLLFEITKKKLTARILRTALQLLWIKRSKTALLRASPLKLAVQVFNRKG